MSQFPRIQGAARLHIITPSIKFNNDGSPAGAQSAPRRQWRRRRRRQLRAEHVPRRADQPALDVRARRRRAVRARRPSTTTAGSAATRRSSRRSRRSTSIRRSRGARHSIRLGVGVNYQHHRRHVDAERQLLGRVAAGRRHVRPQRRIPPTLSSRSRRRRPGSIPKRRSRPTTRMGMEHRRRCGTSTTQLRLAASYRSDDEVQRRRQRRLSTTRAPMLPPGTLAPIVGTHRPALRGGQQPGARTTAASPRTSSCRRSRTCRSCIGSTPQWEIMADVQWTGWSSIQELAFNATAPPAMPTAR